MMRYCCIYICLDSTIYVISSNTAHNMIQRMVKFIKYIK